MKPVLDTASGSPKSVSVPTMLELSTSPATTSPQTLLLSAPTKSGGTLTVASVLSENVPLGTTVSPELRTEVRQEVPKLSSPLPTQLSPQEDFPTMSELTNALQKPLPPPDDFLLTSNPGTSSGAGGTPSANRFFPISNVSSGPPRRELRSGTTYRTDTIYQKRSYQQTEHFQGIFSCKKKRYTTKRKTSEKVTMQARGVRFYTQGKETRKTKCGKVMKGKSYDCKYKKCRQCWAIMAKQQGVTTVHGDNEEKTEEKEDEEKGDEHSE